MFSVKKYPLLVFLVALLLSAAAWAGTAGPVQLAQAGSWQRVAPADHGQVMLSYAPLVRDAAPAVVNIYTTKTVRVRRFKPLFDDPFFQQFFGKQLQKAVPGPEKKVQNSLGSGVVVSPDGLLVTNHHVVEGAEEIKVVLSDRREFAAKIIGSDERTDLAVLKVDNNGGNMAYLELSNSDDLAVGDLVLAIGNPFGVGQTVTGGIVSALARTSLGVSDLASFIQTDAAINPGNSGGALIAMDGRLVGINTAIFSKSGGSMGIGFAIPSNMVNTVVKSIVSGGRAVRPWLGASGQGVDADIATAIGLERPVGVMITGVFAGGPAEKAGLRQGDVILSLEGREATSTGELRFRLATLGVGKSAKISVWRRGKVMDMRLALEPPPETPPRNKTMIKGRNPLAGALVANISPALADELGMPTGISGGVVILDVANGTSAAEFGFKAGDIIKTINQSGVQRVEDVSRLLGEASGNWRLTIERDGQEMKVVFRS